MHSIKVFITMLLALSLTACSMFEDAATSIAYDIERDLWHLGKEDGSKYVVVHDAKARAPSEARTIKVQFDKVGALIVWYMNADGKVLESGATSYLSRFVSIPETIVVDLQMSAPVNIEIQRKNGQAIVTRVY